MDSNPITLGMGTPNLLVTLGYRVTATEEGNTSGGWTSTDQKTSFTAKARKTSWTAEARQESWTGVDRD